MLVAGRGASRDPRLRAHGRITVRSGCALARVNPDVALGSLAEILPTSKGLAFGSLQVTVANVRSSRAWRLTEIGRSARSYVPEAM